ncbi:MAG TPA: hypothetical protein VMG10_06915 [Gemmataceae bacterium]|nr:hypothetical protein [Gemmataceae bacterium]
MPDTIPNLWPDAFKVDVQTPLTILRVQAGLLGKVTRGILQSEVETETVKDQVQHRLVIVAPAYNAYRHTVLVVRHHTHFPYPAEVKAEALAEKVERRNPLYPDPLGTTYETVYPSAHNDDELQVYVQNALRSEQTQAAVLSLIAKSNEATGTPPLPKEPADSQDPQ